MADAWLAQLVGGGIGTDNGCAEVMYKVNISLEKCLYICILDGCKYQCNVKNTYIANTGDSAIQ